MRRDLSSSVTLPRGDGCHVAFLGARQRFCLQVGHLIIARYRLLPKSVRMSWGPKTRRLTIEAVMVDREEPEWGRLAEERLADLNELFRRTVGEE